MIVYGDDAEVVLVDRCRFLSSPLFLRPRNRKGEHVATFARRVRTCVATFARSVTRRQGERLRNVRGAAARPPSFTRCVVSVEVKARERVCRGPCFLVLDTGQ